MDKKFRDLEEQVTDNQTRLGGITRRTMQIEDMTSTHENTLSMQQLIVDRTDKLVYTMQMEFLKKWIIIRRERMR